MTAHDSAEARLLAIYGKLDRMHAWRGWHWWPDADPFEVIVGSILVQNTMWTNVERALDLLRAADALAPGAMAALPPETLAELVRPSGQYRQKAKKLRAFLELVSRQGSLDALLALPAAELRAELLATWGIGKETADAIVLYAARKAAFVIDAYTMRLFGRLALGPSSTEYDEWQRWFVANLPEDRDLWARLHALIVLHCKHLCTKLRPKCGECSLAAQCTFAKARIEGSFASPDICPNP
ncbi:MAG: endonuclease III domain-containing protein [Hyphomicrobiales bacterium]